MQSQENASTRSLPSRDVTEDTIDEAFAHFILYSNPYYPCDTYTSELKECLHNVPKSDGKNFTIYSLWQLVQKLETKELKTWIQLALDLGVEPPTAENKASVQKVQQYTVRLKRWMRALHVDAFFEFLLGKKHSYYLDIPPLDDPYPSQGRDGVLAEEDLALRALDPSFKPKRGRKRNSSPAIEHGDVKRPSLITSFQHQQVGSNVQSQTALPNDSRTMMSAHPDHHEREPWTAVTPRDPRAFYGAAPHSAILPGPQNFQWQLEQTPSTPFPVSAIERSNLALDEPSSAVTPSSTRLKRKHGPAVSSAWSGGRTIGGKVRGRPSAQRSTTDGAFSTFPAASNLDSSDHPDVASPTVETMSVSADPSHDGAGLSAADQRARLRLQVPQYAGGPVRLMTPPAFDQSRDKETDQRRSTTADAAESTAIASLSKPSSPPKPHPQPTSYEALKRALSADLLRAQVHDRTSRLTGPEAKALSLSILTSLNLTPSSPPPDLSTAQTYLNLRDAHALSTQGVTTPSSIKKIRITRLMVDEDGYTVPFDANSSAQTETGTVRHVYDISWTSTLGALNIEYSIRDLELGPSPEQSGQERDGEAFRRLEDEGTAAIEAVRGLQTGVDGGEGEDWKARYELMAFRFRMMRGRFEVAREKVLDTVLSL